MPATFTEAPEVREVAESLIGQYHRHLEGVRVEYVFRSDVPKKGGKAVWGTARKISSLQAYLAGQEDEGEGNDPLFCVTISRPVWDDLDQTQREALVDHELAHCWREDEQDPKTGEVTTRLSTLPHDLEEFAAIYARYGDWRPDLKQFEEIAERRLQLALDLRGSHDDTRMSISVNGGEPVETTSGNMARLSEAQQYGAPIGLHDQDGETVRVRVNGEIHEGTVRARDSAGVVVNIAGMGQRRVPARDVLTA